MKVPLLDFSRQDAALTGDLRAAFERVLASGHFIMGPEVEALERECAAYLGGGVEALGLSSGTDAILLALMALGIGPGDEVICPAYSFFATAGCIVRTGAKPVFVDVLPCCFNIDPAQVAARITSKTKAILPVHLFGQSAPLEPLLDLAARNQIPLIEDAAQAIGARSSLEGRAVGTLGLMGCFSFFPTKNLGALGDGGLLVTPDRALAKRLRALRNHGMHIKYHHESVGGNFRLDALQAAFLRAKLPRLDTAHAARRENADRYDRLFLESGIAAKLDGPCRSEGAGVTPASPLLLPRACGESHIHNQYVIRVPASGNGRSRRDALRQHLADREVMTEIYYPIPLHLQECFADLGYRPGSMPVSEALAQESLALPIFPELRPEEIDYVVGETVDFLKS